MRKQVVIIDYGLGNQTSVQRIIQNVGHCCVITADKDRIARADLAILPGVGAFPAAMKLLQQKQLIRTLLDRARANTPILGICVGMQLLTDSSEEFVVTQGLGLIPGQIKVLCKPRWHIGWNTIEVKPDNKIFQASAGYAFYFNHSYVYSGSEEFVNARADVGESIPVAIGNGRIIGVQFHPEKSQEAGRRFFANLITNLCP